MSVSQYTTKKIVLASWVLLNPETSDRKAPASPQLLPGKRSIDCFYPVRQWLDNIKICDRRFARYICQLIPAQCPFERDVKLFGKVLFRIPPMCKLNPLYEELVGLRFRALCYLADECGEDISAYC